MDRVLARGSGADPLRYAARASPETSENETEGLGHSVLPLIGQPVSGQVSSDRASRTAGFPSDRHCQTKRVAQTPQPDTRGTGSTACYTFPPREGAGSLRRVIRYDGRPATLGA